MQVARPRRDVTRATRDAFLAEVERRVGAASRLVAFERTIDRLIGWSQRRSSLVVRPAGDQNTVSYALQGDGTVLWAAYPRKGDGAKVVVLPRRFRRLPQPSQDRLLTQLNAVDPRIQIPARGTLQVPMASLNTAEAIRAFEELLSMAEDTAKGSQPS